MNWIGEDLSGPETDRRPAECGMALLLALMLIVVLSLLALTFLMRSFVASRVAGIERFASMTFYAADGGVNGAKARLKIGKTEAFSFCVPDLKGPGPQAAGRPIEVGVERLKPAGPPRAVVGSQIGGGQGGDGESLCVLVYHVESRASHAATGSRRKISATLSVGPVPIPSVQAEDLGMGQGGE